MPMADTLLTIRSSSARRAKGPITSAYRTLPTSGRFGGRKANDNGISFFWRLTGSASRTQGGDVSGLRTELIATAKQNLIDLEPLVTDVLGAPLSLRSPSKKSCRGIGPAESPEFRALSQRRLPDPSGGACLELLSLPWRINETRILPSDAMQSSTGFHSMPDSAPELKGAPLREPLTANAAEKRDRQL